MQKEKAHGVKSRRNQTQASKNPLLGETHKTCLIPPAMNYDNTSDGLSPKGNSSETQQPRFFWDLVT